MIDTDHSECSNLLMEVSRTRVEKHFVEMQKDSDFGLESKWKCNEDILSPIILGLISHWSTNQTILIKRFWANQKSLKGSLCKFDTISELIHDQINSLLKIFKTIGAGEPQLGLGS